MQTQRARMAGSADQSPALLPEITRVVHSVLPPAYRAWLFGSRATGAAGPRSDWDIGITGPAPIDGAVVERLREALERLPTLASFDVVDLALVPERFRERALREGMAL